MQQAGVVKAVTGGARPASRRLRHIAGSKRRCWLPEKTTKCLWQEASTLRQRHRTAHLTARSDKSVAYATINKRLYSTFCTVEANCWQTRSITRPLCDSRATCLVPSDNQNHPRNIACLLWKFYDDRFNRFAIILLIKLQTKKLQTKTMHFRLSLWWARLQGW